MKFKIRVDIYFNTIEGLVAGDCEILTPVSNIPNGTWKYCISKDIEIEIDP